MTTLPWWSRFLRALLVGALVVMVTAARAAGGFVATLPDADRDAAGLNGLSVAERDELDRLVASDVSLARQQDLKDLGASFLGRHSDDERHQAGLDRLTLDQQERLNALVAVAVGLRPAPRIRPRLGQGAVLGVIRKPEVHGGVSFGIGGSSRGSFRTSSLWFETTDPDSGLTLGVGLSNFDGHRAHDDFREIYASYGPVKVGFIDASFSGWPRGGYGLWDSGFDSGGFRDTAGFRGDGACLAGPHRR